MERTMQDLARRIAELLARMFGRRLQPVPVPVRVRRAR
jgi:hypothetical protein